MDSNPLRPDGETRLRRLRHLLPTTGRGSLQILPKAALLGSLLAAALGASGAVAQGGPHLGLPQTGETILNRDVEVKSAPDDGSRIVMTLPKGKTVIAFGTPRRTAWTQIGLAGRDVGYVPSDSLDPIHVAREISGRAAVVGRVRWAPDGNLRGTHVLAETVKATEIRNGKRREVTLERGQVLSLLGVQGKQAHMTSETMASVMVPAHALIPIIGVHDYEFSQGVPARTFYVVRVGDYLTPVEAENAWTDFVAAAGQHHADRMRFVYPLLGGQAVTFALAIGPLDRMAANNTCVALAQRMLDCWITEVQAF